MPNVYSRAAGAVRPPDHAVLVDRTTPFGNPFSTGNRVADCHNFREYAIERIAREPRWLAPLRGRDLVCWCKPTPSSGVLCHADVLVQLANFALTVADVKASGGYDVIYLDPAWQYKNTVSQGAADDQYVTIVQETIGRLPISDLAAPDCAMFVWGTYPLLPDVLRTIRDWGFEYKTIAFQWVKYWGRRLTAKKLRAAAVEMQQVADAIERGLITGREHGLNVAPFLGLGNWSRANTEPCFLAVRGRPKRFDAGVSQLVEEFFDTREEEVIRAPLNRHSMKPRQVRTRIAELMGPHCTKLEMFARERGDGFDAWGNDPALYGPDVVITEQDYAHFGRSEEYKCVTGLSEAVSVERLLRALCDGVEEPLREVGCPGRKPVPRKDAAFAAILKVYGGKSQRRAQSDLTDSVERGTLDRVAYFNSISTFLGEESSTQILTRLVEESAAVYRTDATSGAVEFSVVHDTSTVFAPLRSKNAVARENERLAQIVSQNLAQLSEAALVTGRVPRFWKNRQ